LAASRNGGESLDTIQARVSGRLVSESLESTLFNGSAKVFGEYVGLFGPTIGDRIRPVFVLEGANLHCPPPATVGRHRHAKHLKPDLRYARLPHIRLLGRGQGEIHNSSFHKWSPIGNPHHG
jgi:hypothetical protein